MSMDSEALKRIKELEELQESDRKYIANLEYTIDLRNSEINDLKTELKRYKADREYVT